MSFVAIEQGIAPGNNFLHACMLYALSRAQHAGVQNKIPRGEAADILKGMFS